MKALLYNIALLGNVLYILFLVYNGIDEGFKNADKVQGIAPLGLVFLLFLNIYLLRKGNA